jgi:uncharacterized iron-regulated membrane protein
MTYLHRWIRQPQTTRLRKAIFQIHLWSGIGVGLYILLASVTGSILVYSNELYRAATRDPVMVSESGAHESRARLTDRQLQAAATRAYPGYKVSRIVPERNPAQAVTIFLKEGARVRTRLFNPYTGGDLGDSVPLGIRLVSRLTQLHDDLLAGPTGRAVNGVGALLLILLALTGIAIWWPGIRTWRRSLTVHRSVGWRRFTLDLHSMIGFWSLGFLLLFGLSGAYLGNPQPFQDLADRIEPSTAANAGTRTVDTVIYWLAYLHFGRVNGIGIPCGGPGLCDSTTKFIWATFGLAPAALFVTGATMWWNRVIRKKVKRVVQRPPARTTPAEATGSDTCR